MREAEVTPSQPEIIALEPEVEMGGTKVIAKNRKWSQTTGSGLF